MKRLPHLLASLLLLAACNGEGMQRPPPPGGDGGAGGEGGAGGGGGEDLPGVCGGLAHLAGKACDDSFCWEYPNPSPLAILAGAEDPGGGLWLAGSGSPPLHWNGEEWRILSQGLPEGSASPERLFATEEGVWLVQGSRLLRWAETTWEDVDFGRHHAYPAAVWAGGDAIWVAGSDVRRWSDGAWMSLPVVGGPFNAIWGVDGDVWAGGAGGALFRWHQGEWGAVSSGTTNSIRGIWGSSSSDVWFVGEAGTLLHWNGVGVQRYHKPFGASFTSVVGGSSTNVLAIAYEGSDGSTLLYRWNGSLWSALPSPAGMRIRSLWEGKGGSIWLGADGGGLARWTGACFDRLEPSSSRLNDLWAGGWAVGSKGLVLHGSGGWWEQMEVPSTHDLRSVWGSKEEVWVAGDGGTLLRGDAGGFRRVGNLGDLDLRVVRGSGPDDVWVGASDGSLHRWDGRSFGKVPSPTSWPLRSMIAFEGEAWAGTEILGEILRFDGTSWKVKRSAFATPHLFGTSPKDLWLLSVGSASSVLEHWDGDDWTIVPQGGDTVVEAVLGDGRGNLWVAHSPGVLSAWDGEGWRASRIGFTPRALATDLGQLWILTERHLLPWGTTSPQAILSSPHRLYALWAGGGAVWVGGANGSLGTVTEEGLRFSDTGTGAAIHGIGGAADDLWAAGAGGLLLHFDGTSWTPREGGTEEDLFAFAPGQGGLWLVGSKGTILQRSGEDWVVLPFPGEDDLHEARETSSGELWVRSSEGRIFVRDPLGQWMERFPGMFAQSLWEDDQGAMWVGGVPYVDGAHLLRLAGGTWDRFDLGVTLQADQGTAWLQGKAILSDGREIFSMDTRGKRVSLGTSAARPGSLALERSGGLLGLGKPAGILRFHLPPP